MSKISTAEVARRHKLHRRQVLRLVKRGKLTGEKVGSEETATYIFDEDVVTAEIQALVSAQGGSAA